MSPRPPAARIAVDAMGGDHAPGPIVDGALAAARYSGVAVTLVGRPDAIAAELTRHADASALDVQVVEAPDVVAMDESPAVGAAPQAPGVDSRRHRAGARSGRGGGGQRRAHRRRRWSPPTPRSGC